MTKGYHRFSKIDLLLSKSNIDEEKIVELDKKKDFRRISQKLINKLQKIALNTISSNSNEQKSSSNNNNEQTNQIILTMPNTTYASQLSLASTEEHKLKGILKLSGKDDLLVKENNHQSIETIDRQENGQTNIQLNSPKVIKHVRFNENISKRRYLSNKSVCGLIKLSRHQRNKLKKLERKDSLELQTNDRDLSRGESFVFDPLNDSESSDDDGDDD